MKDRVRYRPFTGNTEKKLLLDAPPLRLVLCQVRWPQLTGLQGTGLDVLADALSTRLDEFPLYERGQEVTVTLTPEGATQTIGETVHQWRSVDGLQHVSLTRRSITVFCTTYTSFPDFEPRLRSVLEALGAESRVPVLERIGLRYVNRVTDPEVMVAIRRELASAAVGLAGITPADGEVKMLTALTQAAFKLGSDRLLARTGTLAPGETVDPAVPPVLEPSWVLDLDASRESSDEFAVEAVLDVAGRLADINYDFFKSLVTDDLVIALDGAS